MKPLADVGYLIMAVSARVNLQKPRRTLNRLAGALLALGLGGIAQASFRQGGLWDGLLLFLIGAILFAWAVYRIDHPAGRRWPPYRGLFAGLGLRQGTIGQIGGGMVFLAAFLSLGGYWLFADIDRLNQAWLLYGGSLVVLFGGALLWSKSANSTRLLLPRSPHLIALLIILCLAVALRLWQFGSLPFGVWYDEAVAGLQARRWLSDPTFKPAFYDPINVSGQFLLLYSAALRFISDSVYGLRAVSVLLGVGGVLAGYFFGRTLRGSTFGLILAFFLAVMRWDINFSRIAMTGIDTPFFVLLTLFFLTRLLRSGHLRDAILAGLAIGLGLSFYTAFRLFVLALGVFALLGLLIWRQWWGRRADGTWWGQQLARGMILLLALWIALMPVWQYAIRNPESFSIRLRTTSILNRRDDPNLGRALWNSWGKHLAMFNIQGDRNGRHNLPGEPMLDPLMGVLFVFGIALAAKNSLRRSPEPADLFFLLLLPIALMGGVFSLDFEAPQSLRSIAVLPAIAYFCTRSTTTLAREAAWATRPFSARWLLWPAVIGGGYILALNAHTYFVRQAHNFSSWNAFSTPETLTGRRMAELGPGTDFYLSPFLTNHPTIRFLSPDTPVQYTLPLPDALPIRSAPTRPAALFIHPDEGWLFEQAAELYPAGHFETLSLDATTPPAVHVVELSPADLASLQGLALTYWAGSDKEPGQSPVQASRVQRVEVDWTAALPLPPPFIAEWVGILYVPQYGEYELHLEAPAEAALEIDGETVLHGAGSQRILWELARGNHLFQLTAWSGSGVVRLSWRGPDGVETLIPSYAFYQPPVRANGLLGTYYANPDWNGAPTIKQVDPFLDSYFHFTPLPRPYSVEWRGYLDAPLSGVYGLGLSSVGRSQLYLDGSLVVDATLPGQLSQTVASLESGLHEIRVLFQDTLPRSQIHLVWQPPGQPEPLRIPTENLWPSLDSVQAATQRAAAAAPPFEASELTLSYAGSLAKGLLDPRDIAVDAEGTVYVADSGTRAVHLFVEGVAVDTWTETPDGPFQEPLAVVVDSQGVVWVLDAARQWIYGFEADGQPVGQVGGPAAQFYNPRGLTHFGDASQGDSLVVADTGSGSLKLFATTGLPLGRVGLFGDAPGQFNEPVDALRDQNGNYFVTEGSNSNRWQRVDPFGQPLDSWPLDAPVAVDGSHMTWGPDGSIFMTNSARGTIRRYSPGGELLAEWALVEPIQFVRPVGIFFDQATARLYVSDPGIGQVHILQLAEFDR